MLSATLAAMLIAGTVAAQETPTPDPLTPGQRQAVQAFADDGILDGTSCSPEDCTGTVKRWEVAMWIVRLLEYEPTSHETFFDVDSEQPYASFVETLWDEEITAGCMEDPLRFCPDGETSRGQMAAFVTRAFDLEDTDPPHEFSDVSPTNVFHNHISTLLNTGIVPASCDDDEGLFCPYSPIEIAEAVEWLYRTMLLGDTDEEDDGESAEEDGETGEDDSEGRNGGGGGAGSGGGGSGGGGSGGGGGGGSGGGGGGGSGGGGGGDTPTTTLPPLIPALVGNDGIDLVNGECTHLDPHVVGVDHKSYMILDGTYPVSLVFDDEGPYASVTNDDEFHLYSESLSNVQYRYRVERNTVNNVYFAHHHDGQEIGWNYWIPDTVLERVEDSTAAPIAGEVLFEDGSGNQYRRLRNDRGRLSYGPFDVAPACNDHTHPPDTGNYVP